MMGERNVLVRPRIRPHRMTFNQDELLVPSVVVLLRPTKPCFISLCWLPKMRRLDPREVKSRFNRMNFGLLGKRTLGTITDQSNVTVSASGCRGGKSGRLRTCRILIDDIDYSWSLCLCKWLVKSTTFRNRELTLGFL
jgi:hypothetical protein